MKYVIGIDEVGRGALAGPITVAAVAAPVNLKFKISNLKLPLRDSKKLLSHHRELWAEYIRTNFRYAVARVYPNKIDGINITMAANLAAHRALKKLLFNYSLQSINYSLFLDGGLYVKHKKYQMLNFPWAKTIIKGDEKINAIKLASIVAKVARDRYMVKLHKKYPEYSFNLHKGYGTRIHRLAIKKHSHSKVHRLTFLKKSTTLLTTNY
ncbi:MAG: ribonuclease HII [Candidatus Colwellbacteria bacterium]|nr:ribonuclease HII [Candidatus Colwellbacteria bacterium]